MIIKRLRIKKKWSQEQLAEFSGLSLRTIQRAERGDQISDESLGSLATAFGLDIVDLEEKYIKIDKDSEEWKEKPLWLRITFWGSNVLWMRSRTEAVIFEVFIVAIALAFLIAAVIQPASDRVVLMSLSVTCSFSAYVWSVLIRLSDQYHVWQTGY